MRRTSACSQDRKCEESSCSSLSDRSRWGGWLPLPAPRCHSGGCYQPRSRGANRYEHQHRRPRSGQERFPSPRHRQHRQGDKNAGPKPGTALMIPRVTGSRPLGGVPQALRTCAALYGALSKDIGSIPVPAKCGKATQRCAQRDQGFPVQTKRPETPRSRSARRARPGRGAFAEGLPHARAVHRAGRSPRLPARLRCATGNGAGAGVI